jgi:hypothetical protein
MAQWLTNRYSEQVFLGSSRAVVIDNKDPDHKGRIRVESPIWGATGFIPYEYADDGFFAPPDVGTVVRLEPAGGDKDHPVASRVLIGGEDTEPDTPSIFRRDVPTNRGWVSPGALGATGEPAVQHGGHFLELDDGVATADETGTVTQTAESRGVRVSTSGGHVFKMMEEAAEGAQENRVQVSTSGGQVLQLVDDTDPEKQNITIKDAENRTIEIIKETDRIRIRNASGTIFIDVDIANDVIEIDANNVKLGTSAEQSIVRGTAFESFFAGHTHPAPGGPTGPPFQTMSVGVELSDKHKVE